MAPTFIILTLLLGGLGILTILLAGNIVFNNWKLHFYIKENYASKLDSHKNKYSIFTPTKIISLINDQDSKLIQSTTKLEKKTRYFIFLFVFCFLSIVILTALALTLKVFDKF